MSEITQTHTSLSFTSKGGSKTPVIGNVGDRIDDYVLESFIGEGGFGCVWKARKLGEVEIFHALKLIRSPVGPDSYRVEAFLREARFLASLNHRNLAKIHAFGSDEATGVHFVAMDLCEGMHITDFADAQQLSLPQRLRLFAQVCAGVSAAHESGVVHRDLKPSNILVTDEMEVKIIDFGIAQKIEEVCAHQDGYHGPTPGTPHFMSPEQIQGPFSRRPSVDVYALGVILFELMTGDIPLGYEVVKHLAPSEIRELVLGYIPENASDRVVTAPRAEEFAGKRGLKVRQLQQTLCGDLDAILRKALSPEEEHRYRSSREFAADIEAYLGDYPVTARPASTRYHLGKWIKRKRALAASVVLATLALLAGSGLAIWRYQKEQTARKDALLAKDRAQQEAANANESVRFLTALVSDFKTDRQGSKEAVILRELLDRSDRRREKELKHFPIVNAKMAFTLASGFKQLLDNRRAGDLYAEALGLFRAAGEPRHTDAAACLFWLAWMVRTEDSMTPTPESLEKNFELALSIFEERQGTKSRDVAMCLTHMSREPRKRGDYALAEAHLLRAKSIIFDSEKPIPEYASWWLQMMFGLRLAQGQKDEAERLMHEAITLADQKTDEVQRRNAMINPLQQMAMLYRDSGQNDKAVSYLRQLDEHQLFLSGTHDEWTIGTLANTLHALGREDEGSKFSSLYRRLVSSEPENGDTGKQLLASDAKQSGDPDHYANFITTAQAHLQNHDVLVQSSIPAATPLNDLKALLERTRKSMQRWPEHEQAMYWMITAEVAWRRGNPHQATRDLQLAVTLNRDNPPLLLDAMLTASFFLPEKVGEIVSTIEGGQVPCKSRRDSAALIFAMCLDPAPSPRAIEVAQAHATASLPKSGSKVVAEVQIATALLKLRQQYPEEVLRALDQIPVQLSVPQDLLARLIRAQALTALGKKVEAHEHLKTAAERYTSNIYLRRHDGLSPSRTEYLLCTALLLETQAMAVAD